MRHERDQALLVIGAVVLAVVCCGLPALVASGVLATAAGIGWANSLLIAAGFVTFLASAFALRRRQRCTSPRMTTDPSAKKVDRNTPEVVPHADVD